MPVIGIAFVIANYGAWKQQKTRTEELEQQLKNPVDYDFSCEVNRIVPDLSTEWIEAEKVFARGQFRPDVPETYRDDLEKAFASFEGARSLNSSWWKTYLEELIEYETECGCLLADQYYHVYLSIENVGAEFDQKVLVTVEALDGLRLREKLDPPKKPARPGGNIIVPYFPVSQTGPRFRKIVEFDETGFTVELSEVRVGDKADIIYDGFFIYGCDDVANLRIEVRSAKTKQPIVKTVTMPLPQAQPDDSPDLQEQTTDS